jgi:transcriptional regulator of acetoin/glycerol metabolism
VRQRTDVGELIRKLLNNEADGAQLEIEPALLERLVRHSWPGNVRQLRNVLRTMLALRSSDRLTLTDFNERWLDGGAAEAPADGPCASADGAEASMLSEAERDALRRTLEMCQWNVSAAAARLHISRRTIYRKIHRHGLLRHAHNLGADMQRSE